MVTTSNGPSWEEPQNDPLFEASIHMKADFTESLPGLIGTDYTGEEFVHRIVMMKDADFDAITDWSVTSSWNDFVVHAPSETFVRDRSDPGNILLTVK